MNISDFLFTVKFSNQTCFFANTLIYGQLEKREFAGFGFILSNFLPFFKFERNCKNAKIIFNDKNCEKEVFNFEHKLFNDKNIINNFLNNKGRQTKVKQKGEQFLLQKLSRKDKNSRLNGNGRNLLSFQK